MEVLFYDVPLIGLLIVVLGVYTAWMINKRKKSWIILSDRRARIPFVLGISVCLIGAYLMAFGEGLLGEDHSGIATVIGIIGIGLISTSGAMFTTYSTEAHPKEDLNRGKHVE